MSNARFSIIQARAVRDRRVTDSQLRTLNALGLYSDKDGWCFPKQATLGEDVGKNQQNISKDIAVLIDLGYVESYPQWDRETGARMQNRYRLIFDPPMSQPDISPTPPRRVDNDPSNDPNKYMASGENSPSPCLHLPADFDYICMKCFQTVKSGKKELKVVSSKTDPICRHCGSPIFYDEKDTLWFHSRRTGKNDNGYYCPGEKYLGKHAEPQEYVIEPPQLGIDWQIAAGRDRIVMPDEEEAKRIDSANLIATGTGINAPLYRAIAYVFMKERGILIPQSKVKANRNAAKEMIEQGVLPTHVQEAVQLLAKKNLTVTDLFSISKTAIALANPTKEQTEHSHLEGV